MNAEERRAPDGDETDYAHRRRVNLIALAFLLIVALIIGWTIIAFERQQRTEACLASGRRDCIPLDVEPRSGGVRPLQR